MEFCLWVPVFLFFLAATIDASMIYLTHNAMWNAARDTARRVAVGQFHDPNDPRPEATEWRAKQYLWEAVTVYRSEMDPDVQLLHDKVIVTVQAPIRDISPFRIFGWSETWYGYQGDADFNDITLEATVTTALEPRLI